MQNKGITLALYGVLFIILSSSVYLYCQKRAKQIKDEQDEIEVRNTADKMYSSEIKIDTNAVGGSSFSESSADVEKPAPAVKETKPASPETKPEPVAKPSPTGTSTPAKTAAPKIESPKPTKTATASKWVVRAGTFMYVEGARERLEEVINAGFPDAEIVKTSEGKFAVLVLRTGNKSAARETVEKLEKEGIEAAIFAQ